jgi:hypothetical protein
MSPPLVVPLCHNGNTSSPGATFMHHTPHRVRWEWLLVVVLSVAMLSPGTAQNRSNASDAATLATSTQDSLNLTTVDVATLFAGKQIPFTIKVKSLDRNWRRMSLGETDNMTRLMFGARGMPSVPYYTRGQTVSAEGETYLIAYRLSAAVEAEEMQRRMQMRNDPNATAELKLPPNATLTLSLVNLRQAGSMVDVQPFDPTRDIERPQDRVAAADAQSVANLRQVGLALAQYAQDYDENCLRCAALIRCNRCAKPGSTRRKAPPYNICCSPMLAAWRSFAIPAPSESTGPIRSCRARAWPRSTTRRRW